jgi:hypothetical protein
VQVSPFEDARGGEDAQTTQRRGPEFAQQIAHARGVRDTDVTGKPAAGAVEVKVSDTDPTGKQPAPRLGRKPTPDPREDRDDQDTIIRPNSGFPLPKRKGARKAVGNPDDTIKVDAEAPSLEGDPTQLMASRGPKAPRR